MLRMNRGERPNIKLHRTALHAAAEFGVRPSRSALSLQRKCSRRRSLQRRPEPSIATERVLPSAMGMTTFRHFRAPVWACCAAVLGGWAACGCAPSPDSRAPAQGAVSATVAETVSAPPARTSAPTASATATSAAGTLTVATVAPQHVTRRGPPDWNAPPSCSGATSPCGTGPHAACCGAGQQCCAGGAAGNYYCSSGKGRCPMLP
jgi:hypothetical protein